MRTHPRIPVLAIDGGGTRCRVAFDDGTREWVETGSANVSTDFDGAVAQLLQGVDALAEKLGQSATTLWSLPVFVGVAGVTGPAIANRLRAALPAAHLQIEDDRSAALHGALGTRHGVIAHCGTGSFYASHIDGDVRFAGGWGPVIGDEASAQWVGRAALRLALEAADGRLEHSGLSRHLLDAYGAPANVVAFAGTAGPAEFGALAPVVTGHAARRDRLACKIMTAGADEIACALPSLGWRPGMTLCLTGGIGPFYRDFLPDTMRAALSEPAGTPLDGAVILARRLAQGDQHAET